MFKTLFGLITSNPYIAALIFVGVLSAGGGAFYYVHHLNSTIAALHDQHDADQKANGALLSQKTGLEATVSDQQSVIKKLQEDSAQSQALVAAAQADKLALEIKFDRVLANANAAPPSDDGIVSPLLSAALGQLCNARPSATAAGCGL